MKKLLLLLCFNSFLANRAPAQTLSWQEPDLIGPVKTIRIEGCRFLLTTSDQLAEGPRSLLNTIAFDANGNIAEKTYHNPDGSLASREVHRYDLKGRRVDTTRYDRDGLLKAKEDYRYDEQDRRQEVSTCCKPDGSSYISDLKLYDDKGKLIERLMYLAVFRKETDKYDGSGRLKESSTYAGTVGRRVELISKTVINYASGTIEALSYNPENSLEEKWVYELDARSNPAAEVSYNASGLMLSKTLFDYDYDSQGNWIKKTASNCVGESGEFNCGPTQVTYRTISYY